MSIKVASWNVNSLRQRLEHLARWSEEAAPDVICLQETKVTDDLFPREAVAELGYTHQAIYGQKTYNGVAILSKHPISGVQAGFSVSEPDPQTRLLAADVAGIRIYDCYVPNGSRVGSDKFEYKMRWLKKLRAELDAYGGPDKPVIVCGDINIAPDDGDVWDPFECEGQLLFHPMEREALGDVLDWGLIDAFRLKNPFSSAYSWWDYRGGGYQRNQGFRIDHQFISKSLESRCLGVRIWRDVRGWDRPSDHAPVVVELS
jgi:exodeoxyribonuclease III